ncbi:LPD38 domain-containing protein [Paenibacillus tarimensis]
MGVRDEIRKRREQGMAARERVLSGQYSQPKQEEERSRDFIRNRKITAPETVTPSASLAEQPSQPLQPMVSQTNYKKLGDKIKANEYIEKQKEIRDAQDPDNKALKFIKDNTVDLAAEGVDRFMTQTAPGKFINRFSQGAGKAVGVDTEAAGAAPLQSTGSKAVDVTADVAGNVAGVLTNPSNVGQGLVSTPYRAGQAVAQRFAPKANQYVQKGIEGATAGAIQGGVISGVRGETDAGEMAKNIGIGAATGALADPLVHGVGQALRPLFKSRGIPDNEIDEILALPEKGSQTAPDGPLALPRSRAFDEIQNIRSQQTQALPEPARQSRIDAAAGRSGLPYGGDSIAPPYTPQLPEANPATAARMNNANQARAELASIDEQIKQLATRYEQQVIDQYKYLKSSMGQGKEPGVVIKHPVTGEVIDRVGSISKNPRWYSEISNASNNYKKPSNKELYALARKQVDEGYADEMGDIPSWRRQESYDDQLDALTGVRSQIQAGLREIDPALNITPDPIVDQALRDLRKAGQVRQASVDAPYTARRTTGRPAETAEQAMQRQSLGRKFVDNLSRRQELSKPVIGRSAAAGTRTAVTQEAAQVAETAAQRPVTMESRMTPEERVGRASEQPAKKKGLNIGKLGISAAGKKGRFTHPEDTRTYIRSKTEREPIDVPTAVNEFYSKTVDDVQAINRLDKYVEKVTGKKLSGTERAHMQALNSRGADMTARHILTEELVDAQGNVIGQSLKDITEKIPQGAYTNFTDYLIAKHAPTRMGRGEKVYNKKANMTAEKIEQKIKDYEKTYPAFKEIADELYEWNDKMTKAWLVDTGIITPEMAAAWKKANPFWIPNKRFFSKLEKAGGTGTKRGFGSQNNPVKGYDPEGSERDIIDPLESLIEYTDRYVKTARRNEVMQTIIKNLEKDPEALKGFGVVLKREKVDGKSLVNDEGLEMLLDDLDRQFDQALKKSDLTKDNVISGLINGERVYVRVNDMPLLEALTNLSPQAQNAVVETVRAATNSMKLLTTGINPVFALTRNIFRDIPQAYIFSKTTDNPFRFAWDLLDGIVSSLGNKDLYKRYKAIGGGHSSPVAADRNLLKQSKRQILPQYKKGLGVLPRAYNALENLSNVIEAAPRLAEFKRITKAGGNSYESKVRGLYEAQDITTNFKKRGSYTKSADAFIPYLNAAVQGLDKFARAFKDRPAAVAAKSAAAITIPTAVLYAINHDNPDYQKLSNYTKDNFYLIPSGDGKFIKIPKPRELGLPFGSLLERTMRAWNDEDPESFRDFSEAVAFSFAPPGVPMKELIAGEWEDAATKPIRDTIAGPFVELASNKNFVGAPIVPGYLEGMSPKLQFDADTSEVSKKIGDILNMSPKQLDHLIRSYTGVIGQLGIPATSQGATVGDTLTKQVTADSTFTTDATRYFYELKEELGRQYKDIEQTGEVPEGYSDDFRKFVNKTAGQMSYITAAIRAVDDLPISAKEKKEKKRELTKMRNDLARESYTAVREALK